MVGGCHVDPKNKRKIKASFGECIHDKDILVLLHLLDEFAREYRHYRSESDYHTELQEHADKALSWALEDSSQGAVVTGNDIAFSKLAWFDRANSRAIDINIQHFLEKMGYTKKSAASGKARADLLNSLEALASIRLFPTDGITTLSCSFLDFAYVNPKGKRTSKGYMRIVCNPFTVRATLGPEKGCSVNIDLVAAREIYKHGPKGALFLYHQLCTRVNAGSWSAHGYNMDTLARYIYHDFADKKQQKKIYHRITNVKNCIKCLVKAGWKFVWTEENKIKIYRPKDTYCLAQ